MFSAFAYAAARALRAFLIAQLAMLRYFQLAAAADADATFDAIELRDIIRFDYVDIFYAIYASFSRYYAMR